MAAHVREDGGQAAEAVETSGKEAQVAVGAAEQVKQWAREEEARRGGEAAGVLQAAGKEAASSDAGRWAR